MRTLEQAIDKSRAERWLAAALRHVRPQAAAKFGFAALIALLLLPLVAIFWLALTTPLGALGGVTSTILPRVLFTTGAVLVGTGALTLLVGTLTAWAVTLYRFAGQTVIERALVLPLAVPAYIAAYCWVEVLAPTGTLYQMLAGICGWKSARESFLPDVRSIAGACFILASVLYPYVYLAARASLLQQSATIIEVARTLGCGPVEAIWRVALPLARPALAAAAALAMMEALGDFGAMQYLGVETLTVAIYTTWLQRSSLGGAAQLALGAVLVVLALLWLERAGRQRQSYHSSSRQRPLPVTQLTGVRGALMAVACALPVVLGFGVPLALLGRHAIDHLDVAMTAAFWRAALHSLLLAALAAALAVVVALLVAAVRRARRPGKPGLMYNLIGVGYSLPGTVLALGLLIPLAAFDNGVDAWMRRVFGISTGLMISGSIAILLIAYLIRTLAAALGAIDAGWARLSPNLDAASRTLGFDVLRTFRRVHLPLLRPALGSAAIVVFVECLKELPATLLLRPFNFETLATQVYSAAALEQFEAAGLGALAIVAAGLLPIQVLLKTLMGRATGGAAP